MEKLLLFVKHNFKLVWDIIDWLNGLLYSMVYSKRQKRTLLKVLSEIEPGDYLFKPVSESEIRLLYILINNQTPDDLKYFQPHGFEMKSLEAQYRKPSFLMMGVFHGELLVGYFFLRFFFNRRCFVGRLIDKNYRGKGIGQEMNRIMYETAWRMGFRCFSTISKNNESVMRAHSKNNAMIVIKNLKNNYLLVEFIKQSGI